MDFDKVRIRFRKTGELRLVSHLDVLRCFERILRRAEIPFLMSEGFHPKPRMVFAQSLPLGMASLNEVVELEFTPGMEPETILSRLQHVSPPGLEFFSAKRIPPRTTARPRRAIYHFPLEPDTDHEIQSRCAELLQQSELWVDRIRPNPKQFNIRPYINDLRCDSAANLIVDLWITQDGSARADEPVRLLGLQARLHAGEYLTRTELCLQDEMTEEAIAQIPSLPTAANRAILERPLLLERPEPELEPIGMGSEWGASPNGPVVE